MTKSVLFITDNRPAIDMFAPIVRSLPQGWVTSFLTFGGWTAQERDAIDGYVLSELNCRLMRLQKPNRAVASVLLTNTRPDIMVFAREETTPVEPLLLELAREKGIPTLLVPHGIRMQNSATVWGGGGRVQHLSYLAKQGVGVLRRGNIPVRQLIKMGVFRTLNDFQNKGVLSRWDRYTRIAAYGEEMKRILVEEGVKPENIVITGNPKFDAYYGHEVGDTRRDDCRVLLLTSYLVEFGLWMAKQRENFVLGVCSVVGAVSSVPLTVKVHPVNERLIDYEKIRDKYKLRFDLCQQESLSELVKRCDIAITVTSSAGLEAMVAGKPLVVYNPYGTATAYGDDSGAYVAGNETDLFMMLKEITRDGVSEERRMMTSEFIRQQVYYVRDGKATERIVRLIMGMIGG